MFILIKKRNGLFFVDRPWPKDGRDVSLAADSAIIWRDCWVGLLGMEEVCIPSAHLCLN